jgi:hypothetical protein
VLDTAGADTVPSMRRGVTAIWIITAGLACVAAGAVVTTPFNQCDNIAGTCLRQRQILVITALQATAVAVAILCCLAAAASLRGRLRTRLVLGAVLAATFCISVLTLDPIDNLNNSRTGWLSR